MIYFKKNAEGTLCKCYIILSNMSEKALHRHAAEKKYTVRFFAISSFGVFLIQDTWWYFPVNSSDTLQMLSALSFIVCTPPFCWGEQGWTSYRFFKTYLTELQFLEESCWERGSFSGGCSCYITNKLRFEIFNDKKSL